MFGRSRTGGHRGGISTQLGVSAGVLMIPPLVMATGLTFFRSVPPEPIAFEAAVEQTEPAVTTISKTYPAASSEHRWTSGASPRGKSADRPPQFDNPTADRLGSGKDATVPPAAPRERGAANDGPRAREADRYAANDALAAYYGPVPVTLIVVRKEGEPAVPEPSAAPPTETLAPAETAAIEEAPEIEDAPAAVPTAARSPHLPRVPRFQASNARKKIEPQERHPSRQIAQKRFHSPPEKVRRAAVGSPVAKGKLKGKLQRRADLGDDLAL